MASDCNTLDLLSEISKCESPIERLFGVHLIEQCRADLQGSQEWTDRGGARHQVRVWFLLSAQARMPESDVDYRADFLLYVGDEDERFFCCVDIECDGHDYHERTKEQARHDRTRDRRLLAAGIPTIRFTGSEINRDPRGCAVECVSTVISLCLFEKIDADGDA